MVERERWLVTGATGLVGPALCAQALAAGVELFRASRGGGDGSIRADLRVRGRIGRLLDSLQPDRVFHLGAIARPADAALRVDAATEVNVAGSREVAAWCARNRRWLLFTSTDQVFDGEEGPYSECDRARPVTAYGRMKLEAEKAVLDAGGLVARLGWVLNDTAVGRPDFVKKALARLKRGQPVAAVDDEHRTPIAASDVARVFCTLAAGGVAGLLHVAGADHVTPYALLHARAVQAEAPAELIRRRSRLEIPPAGRPRDLRLDATRLRSILSQDVADVRLKAA